ncbi:hypothetical protein CYLTODRAFT_428784 [Cylindrobasidium torrendii FP15055 ss-10]|uniref:DNA-directed RNA polymerase III subunit Rpc5 n=1 Tax=Cylindrobasidium torrendii FP15055 ss-10 TaxID=1314674 RepID=A0A0D7BRB4_9AGAR|nr:hypothetical protein CYLTODRAFT_428784 [Cylindrobasidium torrendii FP15055 ss-10]
MNGPDELLHTLPIRLSSRLCLQVHQFPLLTRPLQPPPSAVVSGKRITARIKPENKRLEIHVPADVRQEVWNAERGYELGAAQREDDKEKNQAPDVKDEKDRPRLSDIRMQSEPINQRGEHFLGIIRNGELHLHPISETHQFRPTLTYLDVFNRKTRRRGEDDSDEDDGPPPDPDDPTPVVIPKPEKRAKKLDAKEVTVAAKRGEEKSMQAMGSMSSTRKEMIQAIHNEEDEDWQPLTFNDVTTGSSAIAFEQLFASNNEILQCQSDISIYLKSIDGLNQ